MVLVFIASLFKYYLLVSRLWAQFDWLLYFAIFLLARIVFLFLVTNLCGLKNVLFMVRTYITYVIGLPRKPINECNVWVSVSFDFIFILDGKRKKKFDRLRRTEMCVVLLYDFLFLFSCLCFYLMPVDLKCIWMMWMLLVSIYLWGCLFVNALKLFFLFLNAGN